MGAFTSRGIGGRHMSTHEERGAICFPVPGEPRLAPILPPEGPGDSKRAFAPPARSSVRGHFDDVG